MRAFEVLRECTISYTENGEGSNFALYVGDFFFIEELSFWIKRDQAFSFSNTYSKSNFMLSKIYHNKLVSFDKEQRIHEWTFVNDINLISPILSIKGFNVNELNDFDKSTVWYGKPICKDVTLQWERENKLNKIGISII
jgi:hypothetical protein